MRTRKVTAIALSAVFAAAIMLGSADRAEARRGWGWGGIGVGVATALIFGGIYHHRHHGYYYGGYPSYSYGYYPAYRYGYYRPRYYSAGYVHLRPRFYRSRGHYHWYRRHW